MFSRELACAHVAVAWTDPVLTPAADAVTAHSDKTAYAYLLPHSTNPLSVSRPRTPTPDPLVSRRFPTRLTATYLLVQHQWGNRHPGHTVVPRRRIRLRLPLHQQLFAHPTGRLNGAIGKASGLFVHRSTYQRPFPATSSPLRRPPSAGAVPRSFNRYAYLSSESWRWRWSTVAGCAARAASQAPLRKSSP